MNKDIEFKQIILATDGESNVGVDPISVAKEAVSKGITISTIGIIERGFKETPLVEVQKIAEAGEGIWEITDINNFSKTMEMVTQKSVYKTIEQAVSKELKSIIGQDLEDMHPDSRKKIIEVIDKMDNDINIKCVILIDCSASMNKKIDVAKRSIINLFRVLNQRNGKTSVSVIGYPYGNKDYYKVLCPFTENIVELEKSIQKIEVGGTTPTGIALKAAIDIISNKEDIEDILDIEEVQEDLFKHNIV